jgi:hypothetical protein
MKAVLDANHQVIGIECVQLGIEAFFEENNIEHDIENNECQIYKVDMYIIFEIVLLIYSGHRLSCHNLLY